ncbi:Ion channel [Nocardioides alpinus]|uniref:Ion channel n=1 Tax=Nocardioides alpinus TaxID=748909 RepID=A0A1I1B1F5_9ACTN|nr:potassium channel family protein [Nocardioides alpinus]PKH40955.1 two pore domain potassium channel family protein [Nocardioides alpinus]SFB42363.1 Ion channel [Nocardioides alpinus]
MPTGLTPDTTAPHHRRGPLVVVLVLVAVLVCYFTVPVSSGDAPVRLGVNLAITVLSAAFIVALVVRELAAELRGGGGRLRAPHLVILLELTLLVFALTYYTLAVRSDGQMSGIVTKLDALYYAATTMTTVGYGDIHPTGQLARAVTTLHLGVNVVFVAVVARLVNNRIGVARSDPPRD